MFTCDSNVPLAINHNACNIYSRVSHLCLGMHRSDTEDRYRLRSSHFLRIGIGQIGYRSDRLSVRSVIGQIGYRSDRLSVRSGIGQIGYRSDRLSVRSGIGQIGYRSDRVSVRSVIGQTRPDPNPILCF